MTLTSKYPKVSNARLAEIAALAESIASENASAAGYTDVEGLLRKKKITLSYNNYGDAFCGLLEHKGGRFHVYCNADQMQGRNSGRARFTIAHELGHYFIDDHRRCLIAGATLHGSNIDYHPRNPVEQEADCFASNLLMPRGAFREAARHPDGLKTILALQQRFKTSVTSTAVSYCKMQIEPVAVIYWSDQGYEWKFLSELFRKCNCRKTIEPFDKPTLHGSRSGAKRGVWNDKARD